MKTFAVFFIFIFLSVTLPYTAQRENLKVKISARGDTITLKFFQPYVDTKLEGYILGYGSSMFSRQFIQLPEGGEPYETEIDAEPKYLIAVQPAKSNEVKKKCTGKVDLAKPLNLVIGSVTNSSVMLSWGTILKTPYTETYVEDCLEEDGQYTVRYREDEKEKEREKEKSPKWNYQSCPTTHTVIDNLKPDTDYEFGVRADTRDASGEWSPPVTHNTAGPGVDVRALSSVEAPPTSAQPLPYNLPSTTLPQPKIQNQPSTSQYQPTTQHQIITSRQQPKIQHWPSTSHLHTSEQQPTTQHQLTAQYRSTTQPQTTTQNQTNAIKTTSGLQKHTNKPPLSSNKPKVYTSKGLLSRKTSTHQQNTSKHHLIATQNQYSTIPPQKQPRTIKNQPPKENHTHSYTKLQTITIPWSPSSTTFNSPGEPQPTLPLPPAEKHSPSPIRKQPLNAIQTSHSTAPPITTLYQPGAAKHPVTDIQEPVSQSGRVIWNNSSISMPFSQVTTAVQKVGPRHQPAPLSAVNQIKPHPFRKNTFQGKTRGGNGERHKGLLQSKKVQGSGSAPPSVKKSNLVGKFKEKEKVIDLKKEDPIPVPKLYTSTTTKTPANKDVPRTTTLFHLFNDSNFDTGDNSSVFSHVPSSKVDNKGKERFTAPHVIYKTDKHPDEPCSITHSLSFFPEEEVSDINVTAPPRNPPSNLTVVTVEGCPSFIILDWEKADNETTEYEVTTSTKGPHGDEVSVLTTNQTHTAVENLKPESSYEFKVTPKNELGSGPTSQPVTFSTESADPRVSDHRTSKNAIWSSYSFKTESYSECSGRQYVKRTWYRKFVGIQLCNSLRYKIYLSDSLNGKFYDIGDLAGNGEDHCQFVDSFLDGRTGSQLPQDQLPRKKGYYRAMRQEPVSFGDIGGGTHINYASWYECGTSIPGKW
ncbi:target of Nesh-SH3 [Chanos chanos]|uniref:Target of Nesh-SH3 n=1 Tax=Chanos chanos TaxID=29144 RepID=A0A6J2WJ74_CHACN|nr:target of Nesh-SH3-like [Chanos chanos]